MHHPSFILLICMISQAFAAPQFITFKEGKLGVNFGGYHAGVGLGGLLGGGAGGGLFAEAGTPFGQSAKAGLGGAVEENGRAAGGLYAGATAGGNVKASAGLAGGVGEHKAAGTGYASAQSGSHYASSGLGGESVATGGAGFSFSGTNNYDAPTVVVKETEIIKPVHKKVHKELKVDIHNEILPVTTTEVKTQSEVEAEVDVKANIPPPTIVKEIYIEKQPVIVEKHIIHTHHKPHHVHKTAYIGGFVNAGAGVPPPPPPIERRVDVEADSVIHTAKPSGHEESYQGVAGGYGGVGHTGQVKYASEVRFEKNPRFFEDIFNIPISTLKAVGSLLGNVAGGTSFSVQKSASIGGEDEISSKHAQPSSSSSLLSSGHISVETPPATKIIDDIFAIPINTLGAVNKFLENNVGARKRAQQQATEDGLEEPKRSRHGPHGRRRANKKIIIEQQKEKHEEEKTE